MTGQSDELLLPEIVKLHGTNEEGSNELSLEQKKKEEEDALNIFNIKATLAALAVTYDSQAPAQIHTGKRNQR